jgi:translation initiation factor 2 alpha subunit (eIF-2alpha)
MVDKELLKTAASTLRILNRERNEAMQKLARYEKAEELIQKMLNTQEFEAKDVMQKISEFKQMTLGELDTAIKALDMIKGGMLKLGSLSETPAPGGTIDNLTYYLLYGEQQ